MSTRDEIFRDAIGASRLHAAGIDEAFIIDYLIEQLVFERFRSGYLLRIHRDAIKKKLGRYPEEKHLGLSMKRIYIPYLGRFDELFDYRGEATDGWTFWKYRNQQGNWERLDKLRKRL